MGSGTWWAIVHRVTKSLTQLSDSACTLPGFGKEGPLYWKIGEVKSLSRVRLFATRGL